MLHRLHTVFVGFLQDISFGTNGILWQESHQIMVGSHKSILLYLTINRIRYIEETGSVAAQQSATRPTIRAHVLVQAVVWHAGTSL